MSIPIKITLWGDVLCDYEMSKRFSLYCSNDSRYNFESIFENLKKSLSVKNSNCIIANLETPLSMDSSKFTNSIYSFCSPKEFAQALYDCGVKCVATAHNHCMDRGIEGVKETISILDEIGFLHCGVRSPGQKPRPLVFDVSGVRIGMVNFTYGTNAVSNGQYLGFKNRFVVDLLQEQEGWNSSWEKYNLLKKYTEYRPGGRIAKTYHALIDKMYPYNKGLDWFEKRYFDGYRKHLIHKQIRLLKRQNVDLSIAYIHVGGQFNQKETEYTKSVVSSFLDAGFDVVLGNHEHVIHGLETRKQSKQIGTYAIGNFLSSLGTLEPPFDRNGDCSIALNIYYDSDRKCVQKYTFTVMQTVCDAQERLQVWPASEYLETLPESSQEKERKKIFRAASDFTGKPIDTVQSEYEIEL